jgi:hypothetical protein
MAAPAPAITAFHYCVQSRVDGGGFFFFYFSLFRVETLPKNPLTDTPNIFLGQNCLGISYTLQAEGNEMVQIGIVS